MRRPGQELHRRKALKKLRELEAMLSHCDDRAFLQLAWAVNILQSDFGAEADRFLRYPLEAASSDMSSNLAVHKWDIESLITILLSTPKWKHRPGEVWSSPRMDQFGTMATAVNLLRGIENHQAGAYLGGGTIFREMSRIAYRQFEWQRGFASAERLYRYVYVYGQGACADYFADAHGMRLTDFLKIGLYFFTQLHHGPWSQPVPIEKLSIDIVSIQQALALFSRDIAGVRDEADSLMRRLSGLARERVAYLPSALRRFPVIRDKANGTYIAPLPQLIMFRMTAGLYYDIANGPQKLMTEANDRFEEYVRSLVAAYFPRFKILPSQLYGTKKFPLSSPDVLVEDDGEIAIVMECKATKLTYDAQFADDPMQAAKNAYTQLVKGICQLWRFFSHVRRGVYAGTPVAEKAHAVLLTIDSWMEMAHEMRLEALAAARLQLKDEPDVLEEDMRPIVFCSMQDLADVMIVSREEQLLLALSKAVLPDYEGWSFREVRRQAAGEEVARAFPFDVGDLLPWWADLSQVSSTIDVGDDAGHPA